MTQHPLNTEAAARVHYVDPRVRALAYGRWYLITGCTEAEWLALGKNDPAALIEEARGWLRAAVALGLLPLVEPSTGEPISPPKTRCGNDIETALGTYQCERDADHRGDCDERTEDEYTTTV